MSTSKTFGYEPILIGIALLFVFPNVFAHATPPPAWKRHVVAGGRCSVLLPHKPQEMAQVTPNPTFTVHMKIARDLLSGGAYSVIYTYVTHKKQHPEPKNRKFVEGEFGFLTFADLKVGIVSNNMKLLQERDLTLQGYPGKEYRMRFVDKPVVVICRCYLVGETTYQVIYQAVSADAHSNVVPPDAAKFLNSFTLLSPARQ